MREVILHIGQSKFGNILLYGKWHRLRKMKKIGYHFAIPNGRPWSSGYYNPLFDGLIETGRNPDEKGAHCWGHNDAIGIVFVGMSGKATPKQITTCREELLPDLRQRYGEIIVTQHSDHNKKKPYCAGFSKEQMEEFNVY